MSLTRSHARPARTTRAARLLLALTAAACVLTTVARADVTDVTPRFVVVTQDNAPLRSGDKDQYYRVGHLKSGAVLKVDGEGAGWLRVEYPAGSSAYVPVAEARPVAGGKAVALTQPSRLYAANIARGFKSSWKSLLEDPLEPGTELALLEEVRADNGDLLGFRVATPRTARAYVHGQFVRAASAEEARSYVQSSDAPNVLASPERTPNAEIDPPPHVEAQAPDSGTVDTSLLEPIQSGNGDTAPPVTIDQSNPGHSLPSTTDTSTTDGPATETPEPVDTALTIRELEAMYAEVKAQPPDQAELEECLAEHQKFLDSLEEAPYNDRLRAQLQQRIAAINIRIGYRDELRRLEESSAAGRTRIEEIRTRLQQVEASGGYSMVGRLSASAIYDGERLPLLLAIRSIEGAPRTLAYIRPSDTNADVRSLIGRVVGIVGSVHQASDLPVKLVNITRIEPISDDAGLADQP